MLGGLISPVQAVGPGAADESGRAAQAGLQVERADQRLDDIAQHIVAVGGAVVAGLLSEDHLPSDPERTPDLGTGLARDERVEPPRELAFRFLGKEPVEPGRHDDAQYAVAEDLEPLIMIVDAAGDGRAAGWEKVCLLGEI